MNTRRIAAIFKRKETVVLTIFLLVVAALSLGAIRDVVGSLAGKSSGDCGSKKGYVLAPGSLDIMISAEKACLYEQALKQDTVERCQALEAYVDACISQVATKQKDPNICQHISTMSTTTRDGFETYGREDCYIEYASSALDDSVCGKIDDKRHKERCVEGFANAKAAAEGNLDYCLIIKSSDERYNCIWRNSIDVSACETAMKKMSADMSPYEAYYRNSVEAEKSCVKAVAERKAAKEHDVNYCFMNKEKRDQYDCVLIFMDPKVCESGMKKVFGTDNTTDYYGRSLEDGLKECGSNSI